MWEIVSSDPLKSVWTWSCNSLSFSIVTYVQIKQLLKQEKKYDRTWFCLLGIDWMVEWLRFGIHLWATDVMYLSFLICILVYAFWFILNSPEIIMANRSCWGWLHNIRHRKLQIFRKHANFTLILKWAFLIGMFVFVLVCVILPTANLPNIISTPWGVSWWKTQCIAASDRRFSLT